jgi:hypothetical protein
MFALSDTLREVFERREQLAVVTAVAFALLVAPTHAEAQRLRTPGKSVTFYAASDGVDSGNDCLSQARPCTPQGAQTTAQHDWDFGRSACTIRLAPGSYEGAVATVLIHGQYLGAHLCQFYGDMNEDDSCRDRNSVVFKPSPGHAAFDVQDGAMTSIICLTLAGEGAIGVYGRQHVVIDAADINCGTITHCVLLTHYAAVNFARWTWITGDHHAFISAHKHSNVLFGAGSGIAVLRPVSVGQLFLSYGHSEIELVPGGENSPGFEWSNPSFLAGSKCITRQRGTIVSNGVELPCTMEVE